ncbi:MAG: sugar phosphate isomerase/epimerase family protein [Candidatus Hydrogenedentota bacterium]
MGVSMNRRRFLGAGLAGAGLAAAAPVTSTQAAETVKAYQEGVSPWPLALNASTIRPVPPLEKIAVAADTGWDAIELWIDDLEALEKEGHDLKDVAKRVADAGLYVNNIIGLWNCMPATEEAFEESLGATRERLRRSAAVGSRYVAAIPAPDRADFDLKWGAQLYKRLLDIGRDDYGIKVAFEFVGFLEGVHRLGQAAAIALDANDPDASLVCDTFHLYRGGSGFRSIRHLAADFIANFHWNDMPAGVPRSEGKDAHRIYPGEGILPLEQALRDLKDIGYKRSLSLELFRREHWEADPREVARAGLDKLRANIVAAGV